MELHVQRVLFLYVDYETIVKGRPSEIVFALWLKYILVYMLLGHTVSWLLNMYTMYYIYCKI